MRPRVLVVDDHEQNVELLEAYLAGGYEALKAYNGEEALEKARADPPDLILLDVIMPGLNGYEVCRRLKQGEETRFIPVVMVTALQEKEERIKGLEAGADDFLTKPVDQVELLARVKSLLRIKQFHDESARLNRELKEINGALEQKVTEQVEHIQRMEGLKRYLSPQVAEELITEGTTVGRVKRKNLTVFFTDIRGFTNTAEETEPEDLLEILNRYFSEMVQIVFDYGGIVGKFMGDGIMGFIGDPYECPDHAERAVKMALDMQSRVKLLSEEWPFNDILSLGIGIGINTGYVTVGNVGSPLHMDYTTVGKNVNLAARLEQEAKPGQTLISQRTYSVVKHMVEVEKPREIEVKGFAKPVMVYNVCRISGLK
jgi:class 3 adenylate cyclase/CheY-like chemotaxis protein